MTNNYTLHMFSEILRETEKAYLFRMDNHETWAPKSKMLNLDMKEHTFLLDSNIELQFKSTGKRYSVVDNNKDYAESTGWLKETVLL